LYYETKVYGIKVCFFYPVEIFSAIFAHRNKTSSEVPNLSFSSTGNVNTDTHFINFNIAFISTLPPYT
jgi:hypothetical protein